MNLLYLAYVNEIMFYIQNEKEYDSVKNNENGVLDYLNSLQYADFCIIADKMINDDYLSEKLNETIKEYVYEKFNMEEEL